MINNIDKYIPNKFPIALRTQILNENLNISRKIGHLAENEKLKLRRKMGHLAENEKLNLRRKMGHLLKMKI